MNLDGLPHLNVLENKCKSNNKIYIHKGLTSSDVLDTTFSIQLRDSAIVIKKSISDLLISIEKKINDNINKSNKEVVKVVNKAINRASSLIKYLMENHQSTPPLRKIKQKDSIDLLRIDYNCPLDKVKNPFALEKNFIDDYRNNIFVKNQKLIKYDNIWEPVLRYLSKEIIIKKTDILK